MTSETINFDLLIDLNPLGEGYRSRVIQSPAGEAVFDFDLLPPFVEAGAALSSQTDSDSNPAESDLDLRMLGAQLYAAAFGGQVGQCLQRSMDAAARQHAGLRIRLRFDPRVGDLAELPWEILYDPEQDRFLGLSGLTPIVHYVEQGSPVQPLKAHLPLTLLALVSSPKDITPLQAEQEWENLHNALDPMIRNGSIVVERLPAASLSLLQQRLQRGPVDLLHFFGHGYFDSVSNTGGLIFEDEQNNSEIVSAEMLGTLIRDHQSLRLVFLNACQSARGERGNPFSGVARQLLRAGVPAVLAMRFAISESAATTLSHTFYEALAGGRPVDTALGQARQAIAVRAESREWATPVLYSRSDDNRLFDLADVLPAPACPYPGMVPFRAEETRFFFGREEEIDLILRLLRHQQLLFVIGPSGSGKSSLIAAGVLPRLASGPDYPPGYWLVRSLRPGSQPQAALEAALGSSKSLPAGAVDQLLVANPSAQRLLLVVDQFEEIFSVADAGKRQEFIESLGRLLESRQCALVAAMRADFYSDLMNSDLWPLDSSQRMEIAVLRGNALQRAIQQPAEAIGVEIDDALVERLVADGAGEPGLLPMLQETLQLLWTRMIRRHISLEEYEALGDGTRSALSIAIAMKADAAVAALPADEQRIARRIFLRLVQFGVRPEDTRRQLPEVDLRDSQDDPAVFVRMLQHLADNRLLTLSGGETATDRLVDLSHERLISDWPKLKQWIVEHKEAEQTRRRLEVKTQEWIRLGRDQGGLLDRLELAEAEEWLAGPGAAELGASEDLSAFVDISRKSINPGWNPRGTAAMLLGLVSLAALAAWIYLQLEISNLRGISRAVIDLFLVSLWVLLALAAWQAVRSGGYVPQRLSQSAAKSRRFQMLLGLLVAGTFTLWAGLGIRTWQIASACASEGINWTSDFTSVAVVAEGVDPKEADFFRLAFQNAVTVPGALRVMLTDRATADRCSALFDHRITFTSMKDANAEEGVFTALLAPFPTETNAFTRVGAGCGQIYYLAHDAARALGYSQALDDNCQITGPLACEAWYANEEAYALYRQREFNGAEAKFKLLIQQYPKFAWAHHNLGMSQLAACSDPAKAAQQIRAAVDLTAGACGWFWYDLALACRRAGDYECALDAAQTAISLDPERVDAINSSSVLLRELGRLEESAGMLDEYEKQLGDQPTWQQRVALKKNRGIWAFQSGQYPDAVRFLEAADAELQPMIRSNNQPSPYEEEIVFYLARSRESQGEQAKACDLYRRYQNLVQGCGPGETERRDFAVSKAASAECVKG